jgi:cytochrome b561
MPPAVATTGGALLARLAPNSHFGFYVLVALMAGTGYATALLAGLPAIVFGRSGAPLPPTFLVYPSRIVHGYVAILLAGLIARHALAACYHQFVKNDRLFARMSFGRRVSTGATPAE